MMIFVTGGAGYIGSHTCVELMNAGHEVTVFDNFCNSQPEALARVERISGQKLQLIQGDVRDHAAVRTALVLSKASGVIHFAGLKAVGESVAAPLDYYANNVAGSISLLQAMKDCGLRTVVFSSSATVYGEPQTLPLTEDHALSPTNPYGRSKLMTEDLLRDLHRSDPSWRICILRYFNPAGAHSSGLIGEDPRGTPNNLMPFVAQVAIGQRPFLNVWGDDYPTPDGTGVRDFIHVVDLADGHVKALQYLERSAQCIAVNLGTGIGYSVLEMVRAFERASGRLVPFQVAARRPGDIASCFADPALAHALLGWRAEHTLQAMCEDGWRWQSANPHGYGEEKV